MRIDCASERNHLERWREHSGPENGGPSIQHHGAHPVNPVAYEAVEPCPELRPFVRRLIVAHEDGLENTVMHPVPTGYNYLLWAYDGDMLVSIDRSAPRRIRGLNFFGQFRNHDVTIKCRGRVSHILAEFTATGLYRLTHVSGSTIYGKTAGLEELSPKVHARLTDCLNTPLLDMEGSVRALEEALLACVEDSRPEIDYLEHTAREIELVDGRARISELSREAGISQRQLSRKYKDIVGVGPKFFSKVLQTNAAFSALMTGSMDTLGSLAHEYGYYDQAHFVRAVQEIFRQSPSALLRNCGPDLLEFLRDSRRFGKVTE